MHHKPNMSCGYLDGVCKGIQLLRRPQGLSCNGQNDFFLLPTKFQGIIPSTQFIDLGSMSSATSCVLDFDPLGQGLFDAFGKLGGLGVRTDICYQSDSEQRPGILLPTAQLSAFSPALLQAIPTVALGNVSKEQINNISLQSACNGLKISARRTGTNKIKITVSPGVFQASTDQDGQPVDQTCPGNSNGWQITGKDNVKQVQVWQVIQQNLQTGEWTGVLTYTTDGEHWGTQKVPTKHIKKRLLGTVSYSNGRTVVNQTQCSPIDFRDGTDKRRSGSKDKYVLVFDKDTGGKKWVGLNQCG